MLEDASPRYVRTQSPPLTEYAADSVVYDELVQMNIGEIRTRIHHCLFTPVLLILARDDNRQRLERLLTRILLDETSHIAYTASLLDKRMVELQWASEIRRCFMKRTRQFNTLTIQQVHPGRLE